MKTKIDDIYNLQEKVLEELDNLNNEVDLYFDDGIIFNKNPMTINKSIKTWIRKSKKVKA